MSTVGQVKKKHDIEYRSSDRLVCSVCFHSACCFFLSFLVPCIRMLRLWENVPRQMARFPVQPDGHSEISRTVEHLLTSFISFLFWVLCAGSLEHILKFYQLCISVCNTEKAEVQNKVKVELPEHCQSHQQHLWFHFFYFCPHACIFSSIKSWCWFHRYLETSHVFAQSCRLCPHRYRRSLVSDPSHRSGQYKTALEIMRATTV